MRCLILAFFPYSFPDAWGIYHDIEVVSGVNIGIY